MRRFYPRYHARMCGRFALHASPEVVALQFGLAGLPAFAPRYNIAPTADVLIVRLSGAAIVRWGLIPSWAKDASMGARMINARAETVATKPAFRDAYRRRRCLIPASGFYEWRTEHGLRQPYYVRPSGPNPGAALFAFAGLWERWRDLETCAIVTTDANGEMRRVHDRMPVLVAQPDYRRWLEGGEGMLDPGPSSALELVRVSRAVNDARNESPVLIEPEKA